MVNPEAVRLSARRRGRRARIAVDGVPIEAHEGEMLAAALMAAGVLSLRSSPRQGSPRGAFCLMGVCQECLVRVAGSVRQACLVTVADGLSVSLIRPDSETA